MIGIAIDQEAIRNVDQKLLDFFPQRSIQNLDGRKKSIALHDLLSMTRRVQKPHPNGFVVKLGVDLFVRTCKTDGNKINPQWLSAQSLTVDIRNITYKANIDLPR